MPVNNNLPTCGFPMNVRFDEKPTTVFKNNLDSIKVTLLDHPDQENVINYMSMFLDATWVDTPAESANMSKDKIDRYIDARTKVNNQIEKQIEKYKDEIRKLYERIKRNEIQTEKDVNELHNIFGDPF